ncbi:MAG: succinylglutamate desuccinylase/aspartoacylase family protein [Anaerolineaceae bacterium]|jgi:predicted deacylase
MIKLANIESKRGEIQSGYLKVGSLADGAPINLPFFVAQGEQDGPVLWLQGGIHGEEYGGSASIIRCIKTLDLTKLKGTLVAFPVVNPPSYLARSRISSLDGENLNRIFPGNADGTFSHQLANILMNEIIRNADYLLDLHSGGVFAEVPFYTIYTDVNSEASRISKKLAKSLGPEVVWKIKDDKGLGGAITSQVTSKGVPSVTVEVGGGTVTDIHLEQYRTAITNMMIAIGMLDGVTPKAERYTIISDGLFIFNHHGGMFVPDCKPGDFLKKGEKIGHIVNLHGDVVEDIINEWENGYISAIRHNYSPTDVGELVAESISVETVEDFYD